MDKKKIIGTIIGVVAFVALIASATYAWLTATASVNNGTLNTGSRNFVINYTRGSDLSDLPILTIANASAVASNNPEELTVYAGLASLSTPPGNLSLTLVTSSDTAGLVSAGALKYAVKVGASGTITAPQTVSSNNQLLVLSGTNTTTQRIDSTTQTQITVYVWLDAATVVTGMVGESYSGYIKATASQLES